MSSQVFLDSNVREDGLVTKGDWVVILFSSSRSKLVKITGKGEIRLGKFGAFNEPSIIGKPYDLTYEITISGDLVPVLNDEHLPEEQNDKKGVIMRNVTCFTFVLI